MSRTSDLRLERNSLGPQDWNRALFQHFFVTQNETARPVSRLVVSPEELAKAAGVPGIDPQSARESFLAAIRCSPPKFRWQLSSARLIRGVWDRKEPPPFLAYLFFTCFAAASLDTETVDEGVFRERLRQLLKHPVGTSYALTELPILWRAFAAWLDKRREEGAPYRALVLPGPGRMTLIGYSIRLAFPSRVDRLRLVDLISAADWGATPTVPEVFVAIDRERNRFSSDFREVFVRARRALETGCDAAELEALWSAVVEAAGFASAGATERRSRLRYQLFLQEDEILRAEPFLVASAAAPAARGTVTFAHLEEPFGEYGFLVRATAGGSTTVITKLLLLGALADRVPDLKGSSIDRAVEQGVLLFRRNDNLTWELAVSRPEEGTVRALIVESLSEPFLRLFRAAGPSPRSTKFDGWLDIGPFDMATLQEPSGEREPRLSGVRCLQRTRVGSQLHIAGGVRVDGGYLGTRGLLPEVRCPAAREVTLFHVHAGADGIRTSFAVALVQHSERPDTFSFTEEQDDLEGRFNLVATRDGQVVATREVVFHARILGCDYAVPTEPQRWIVEAGGPDVLPASEGAECFLSHVREEDFPSVQPRGVAQLSDDSGECHTEEFSMDDVPGLDRFVEAVAAISVARKGIAESELVELLQKILRAEGGRGVWDVVRAWLEAGFLDVFSRRHWRGRVYFARRPRLVFLDGEFGSRVVLHGLAPYRLRTLARKVFAEIGAVPLGVRSFSREVGVPLTWTVESIVSAEAAVQRLALGALEFVRAPHRLAMPIEAVTVPEDEMPSGYERQGVWDWEQGGFPNREPVGGSNGVRIEWHIRMDRPDRYVVFGRDGTLWSTFARTWALLVGHRWAERRPFEALGRATLLRPPGSGPYIPLPVARALVLRSGAVSGPMDSTGQGRAYAYRASNAGERDWLLHWLCGRRDHAEIHRRFAWLLAAARQSSGADVVVPPADLRRRLHTLAHIPDAVAISDRRIPRRMLPHLRRTIEMAGA